MFLTLGVFAGGQCFWATCDYKNYFTGAQSAGRGTSGNGSCEIYANCICILGYQKLFDILTEVIAHMLASANFFRESPLLQMSIQNIIKKEANIWF